MPEGTVYWPQIRELLFEQAACPGSKEQHPCTPGRAEQAADGRSFCFPLFRSPTALSSSPFKEDSEYLLLLLLWNRQLTCTHCGISKNLSSSRCCYSPSSFREKGLSQNLDLSTSFQELWKFLWCDKSFKYTSMYSSSARD